MENGETNSTPKGPSRNSGRQLSRAALSAVGGAVPFAGGVFSAISGYWAEEEQSKINAFLEQWLQMLQDELSEKERTILEVTMRLDMHDEAVRERIESEEYQAILKKSFREWSAVDSENKRILVRNILANSAASTLTSDDVVKMFLDWMKTYSDMHFEVIASVYNSSGIGRGEIWSKIGRENVREDSAEADLFKLLMRDLSVGGVLRQKRETDYHGNFIKTLEP